MLEVFQKIAEFLELSGMKNIAKQLRNESKNKSLTNKDLFIKKNNALGNINRCFKKNFERNESINKKLHR